MMYWFAGFVALAVFLSGRICFGTVGFNLLEGDSWVEANMNTGLRCCTREHGD
jgi:hypothetical protein